MSWKAAEEALTAARAVGDADTAARRRLGPGEDQNPEQGGGFYSFQKAWAMHMV